MEEFKPVGLLDPKMIKKVIVEMLLLGAADKDTFLICSPKWQRFHDTDSIGTQLHLFKRPCGLCRRSGFLVSKLSLWVALGIISALNFYVFLRFGGRLAHLGSSLGPKGGAWRSFRRQACLRVVFGVPREWILMAKVAQETPRVANSHQKSAQRGVLF